MEQKIEGKEHAADRFSEIANVEEAINYIEESISKGTEITHHFIRELHQLAVRGLEREGDKTPGAYRTWPVQISRSTHLPPEPHLVQSYMDELLKFINREEAEKYELIKTALAHHRFVWIHPFGNGNGRVVRLMTYALLIKYGFNVQEKLINPTAVFCNDREVYYNKLAQADEGNDKDLLDWNQYVLEGILVEVSKINRLLDYNYLYKDILLPTIEYGEGRAFINATESKILKVGIKKQKFKISDLTPVLKDLSSRQITHLVSKMKDAGFLKPLEANARTYYVNFMNNFLMRGLIQNLEKEGFIPPIDK